MSILLDFLFPRFCLSCSCPGFNLCPACTFRLKTHNLGKSTPPFEGTLSLFNYRPPVSGLIKQLKFKFITDLAPTLSGLALASLYRDYPNLVDYWRQNHFVFCPVPLYYRRQLWRGFNQAELLGSLISSGLNLSFNPRLLVRRRFTRPQSTLASEISLRARNVADCFELASNPPSRIILFDDVATSGSTLLAAASVFPQNTQIWALTLASKL